MRGGPLHLKRPSFARVIYNMLCLRTNKIRTCRRSHYWDDRPWTWTSAFVLILLTSLGVIQNVQPTSAQTDNFDEKTPAIGIKGTKCYDSFRRPQKCIPEFENAAFNVLMEATNTCGENQDIEFCVQTSPTSTKKICNVCRKGDHEAKFLTDFHTQDNQSWWQSETMFEGIQYTGVNLTLHLKKAFDITYVRLVFYSPRPHSFAIYKRTTQNGPWIPYQYYSATCRDKYGLPEGQHLLLGEETRALCTSEYSDISPLREGNVAFSTLEGRPGAYYFDTNPAIQEWVQATDIRITLDRLNTFGDELFGDGQVFKSYFYSIADVAVGARCTCNGHASECVNSTGPDGERHRVCLCEHNTAGPDCGECLPFYNDAPWKRATFDSANECKPCNCNGFSNRCIFDEALYNRTGHGGHCLECSSNRDGPNCERCRVNYYQREDGRCMPCDCNEVGSRNLQCNREGKCQCKPGVAGDKCDHCAANHFDFGSHGCKLCGCSEAGSRDNTPSCDTVTGVCLCKENVEGKRCRECKPGFFNLDLENEFGCTPCFCYGHASVCDTAHGYSKVLITSFFDRSNERWRAEDEYRRNIEINYKGIEQSIAVGAPDRAAVYLLAPDRFLGDQRASYNRDLQFTLRIGENGASPTAADVRLEGSDFSVSNTIFGQGNPLPGIGAQDFKFRLHEHPDYGWQPHLSARAFMSILANLTAIKIRATYTPRGVGFLDNVRLATAQRGAAGEPANWIERCECPTGYVGQFCESCAPGYRHSPAFGGPFMQCELCDCNKHAEICDSETGRCICQHNTAGDNCEVCAKGYYGNALLGTQYDCKPCLCPNNGACLQLPDNTTVCLECPAGYAGPRCDICSDGYFGDPTGESGVVKACLPCVCNHNIDLNAVGNCNRTTGECLKCIHNTAGKHCDHCLPGYYGDALAVPKGDCKQCECYPPGTKESDNGPPLCDQLTGQCSCKPHVLGRNCDQCEDGFYNIDSGEGCQHCNCDSIGSYNHTCNVRTGQCYCRPGITGLRCDKCEVHKYGFSREGCKSCDCDPIGSAGLQCESNGQCPCLPNVEGRICDRCKENKYDRKQGCIDCPPCYNLVLDAVNDHQRKLTDLKKILDDIANNPTVIDDKDFENKLEEVQRRVHELFVEAQKGVGSGGLTLTEHLSEIKNRLKAVHDLLDTTTNLMSVVEINTAITRGNVSEAESITDEAKQLLNDALLYLSVNGTEAYERAVEKSKEYGHQNDQMKAISHEARQKADELELEAKQIQNTANLARNMSSQAYEIAKKSVDKLSTTNHNTGTLKNVITSAKDKLETTQLLTKDTQERAQEVHKEALDVLQEVNTITIPPVNTKKLKNDAQWEAEEANQIIDKIDKLENQHKDMVEDILDLIDQSSNLLTNATDQQQLIDELLSDADAAKSKAEKAVALGDKTLEEATKTYETLRNFDQQVQDSKDAAANALEEVDKIRELIYDSSNKTEDAKRALLGAESNAEQARNTAQQAQNMYAEPASIEAEKINLEADTTHKQAAKLRLEANDFADRVAETANTLKNFEDQAVNDKNLISEAKRKVGQAESDSTEASKQVKKAVDEVQQIITILIDLPSISTKELDALEEKLKLIEMNFTAANLDQRIQQVREEKQKQILLIGHYEKEVERLTKEVENIRDISESLPDGCFKRTKLEP